MKSSKTVGLTGQANGGGILQSVLLQFPDFHLSCGGDVGPGVVRHAHLQTVRARRSPLPDTELTRALVQTERPERGRELQYLCFMIQVVFFLFCSPVKLHCLKFAAGIRNNVMNVYVQPTDCN